MAAVAAASVVGFLFSLLAPFVRDFFVTWLVVH